MLNKIIYILLLFSTLSCFSQNVFYGFPNENIHLYSGDMIIINIPSHTDGRFNSSKELNRLISFINENKKFNLIFYINITYGSSGFSLEYSKSLKKDLKKILNKSIENKNYSIKAKGDKSTLVIQNNKIFKNVKDKSRIDIYIK